MDDGKLKRGSAEEDIRLLSMVDIFEPLSREEIEAINWRRLETSVGRGETFYMPMDLGETLFILKSGRVRLFKKSADGREFTLAVLESGTVFGEMSITAQRLRNAYAQAIEPSRIAAMCRADVERLIMEKPRVGLQLIHLLSDRLNAYEIRMEDLAFKKVPARLASLIFLLIESQGVRTSTGYKIPTRYTHQQLGTMIGANREAVTRAFSILREAGAVEVRRRYICVENLEVLQKAAESNSYQEA
ncbi:MAG TPA: Crp/Fnr family transcriptional regulator [Rubrobacteraceae bacterium]|nr:Crp/Fnr family transcriptional regulator [Rubrobacteraceae bacterium]